MTKALESVFKKLSQLPDKEQDAFAALLSDELNWDFKFQETQDKLSFLANEATEEYKNKKTKPWDLK